MDPGIHHPVIPAQTAERVDLDAVRQDYRVLDRANTSRFGNVRVISHGRSSRLDDETIDVEHVDPGLVTTALRFLPLVGDLLFAWRVLKRADEQSVLLCNGSSRIGKLICVLNHLLPIRRRKTLMWDSFVETNSRWKRRLVHWMVRGCTTIVVFSRREVRAQARYVGVSEDRFVFLPYKSNHSKRPPIRIPIGNYIFSGGNSCRDYRTLFEAVCNTRIPVIVSTTSPEVTQGLEAPANVILLAAREPAFARLMAASRFAVYPMRGGMVRGAGEASVCNAMWHGKPVIVADDVSAPDHVQEGVTGHCVPAGDVDALRERIVDLWNDPRRVAEMGRRAHDHVAANLTHEHFIHRLVTLAKLVAAS